MSLLSSTEEHLFMPEGGCFFVQVDVSKSRRENQAMTDWLMVQNYFFFLFTKKLRSVFFPLDDKNVSNRRYSQNVKVILILFVWRALQLIWFLNTYNMEIIFLHICWLIFLCLWWWQFEVFPDKVACIQVPLLHLISSLKQPSFCLKEGIFLMHETNYQQRNI